LILIHEQIAHRDWGMVKHADNINRNSQDKGITPDGSPISASHKNSDSFDKNDQQRHIHHQIIRRCTSYQIILIFTIFAVIYINSSTCPLPFERRLGISMDGAHLSDYISLAEVAVVGLL
jgi:hypothetical protein